MSKKKKQKPKKKKKKKSSKKRKSSYENDYGGSSRSNADRPIGLMSGMRSGMTDVAKGQSKWLDIFLWILVILAFIALAYRMGWISDPNRKPRSRTQRASQPSQGRAPARRVVLPPGRTGVQPPARRGVQPPSRTGVQPPARRGGQPSTRSAVQPPAARPRRAAPGGSKP